MNDRRTDKFVGMIERAAAKADVEIVGDVRALAEALIFEMMLSAMRPGEPPAPKQRPRRRVL